jgi:hypothetical protein
MPRLSRSTIPVVLIAGVVLALSLSGGAMAAKMITGKQIKDSTVTTKDIKNGSLQSLDLSAATIAQLQNGATGPTGPAGPAGATGPAGAAGAAGAPGAPGSARGYAHVSVTTTVDLQSGGVTATSPQAGTTCVNIPGLDGTASTYVVTPDYSNDSTGSLTQAYVEAFPGGCNPPAFGVRTFSRATDTGLRTEYNEPFFIVVP